jgi:hypothetical protein
MFITDETVNSKSHVIFFRCSLCVSEHVSSVSTIEVSSQQSAQRSSANFQQASMRVQHAI